jgi:hypothetical protein
LAFQWRGPVSYEELMNVDPLPTWVNIAFESVAMNKTIVHFRHSGWGEGERWAQARQWQAGAWNMAFKALGEIELAHSALQI